MSTIANIYEEDIDFAALALQDPDFARLLKSNGQLDFSNPESVQQLTKSLLKRDFGLKISLPDDRLCPPVPNRLNYIIWIQSLLDSTSDTFNHSYEVDRDVLGLDIGTGASCIYPLLGCSLRPKWRFAGTEVDDKSFQFAKQNIQANALQSRIKLLQTKPDEPLFQLDKMGFENIDFTMCNPPFYLSKADLVSSASSKQRPPFTACTGSESEMVTPGGETVFVSRMIDESLSLRDRVQWYSSMLGKYSSVTPIVERLKKEGIDNYAVTEFVQGSRTRRWAVAWSFDDLRPSMSTARGVGSLQKHLLPFPSEYLFTLKNMETSNMGQRVNEALSQFPLKWMWKPSISVGLGLSEKAVWSRSARRQAAQSENENSEIKEVDEDMSFGFKIQVEKLEGADPGTTVIIRWIKGHDSVIFESFCGMLKRKLEEK